MELAVSQAFNNDKLLIADTKYAIARFVLDAVLEKKTDRMLFANSLRSDVVDTMKQLQTKYKTEAKLYDLVGVNSIANYYKSSSDIAIMNNQWNADVKKIDMQTNENCNWDIENIESFNIPPLTLGSWVKLHRKYNMDSVGYALPLYTLHGLDVLHSVIVNLASRFQLEEGGLVQFEIENVQNLIFYKLIFGPDKFLVVWLDNVNLPSPWQCNLPSDRVELIDRCYIMTRNIKLDPLVEEDNILQVLIGNLVVAPMLIYSPDMPYDLKPFPNFLTVFERSLRFTAANDLWRQLSNLDYKYSVLVQQSPRSYSGSRTMSRLKLHSWLSMGKIPSNLLARNVNNIMKRAIKGDKNSIKLVYVVMRKLEIYIFDVGVTERPKFSLGPLCPPIVLASANFEGLFDCSYILQNVIHVGVSKSIVITNCAIRPMPRSVTQLSATLENVHTMTHSQMNSMMQSHFNQATSVQPKVIVTVKGLQFALFQYKDIDFYTFISSSGKETIFNFYDIMLKLLLENKQKIFKTDKNLGITISHLIDYASSSK